MRLKLFLDLEDTIITSWHDPVLINAARIKEWIQDERHAFADKDEDQVTPCDIHIFSFAIWDDEDKEHFVDSGMKTMIEQALEAPIIEWLSVKEMRTIVSDWQHFKYESKEEFMQFEGKHGAFTKVCLARETDVACILLDDAVPRRLMVDRDRCLTVVTTPVQTLTGDKLGRAQKMI